MADFATMVFLQMAKARWKRACKAGAVAPEDVLNPAYKDGFIAGVFAAQNMLNTLSPQQLTQLLLSPPVPTAISMVLRGMSEQIWERSREPGWGNPSQPNDPVFKGAFFLGTEITFSDCPTIRKLQKRARK